MHENDMTKKYQVNFSRENDITKKFNPKSNCDIFIYAFYPSVFMKANIVMQNYHELFAGKNRSVLKINAKKSREN